MPRWALGVIVILVAAVLVLGGAWWQSSRAPTDVAASSSPPNSSAATVERRVDLPAPAPRAVSTQQAAPSRLPTEVESSLSAAAASSTGGTNTSAGENA